MLEHKITLKRQMGCYLVHCEGYVVIKSTKLGHERKQVDERKQNTNERML